MRGSSHANARDRGPRLRHVRSEDLTVPEVESIRVILDAAFGSDEEDRFTEDDWNHALGGMHFVLDLDGDIVAHAAVVERLIEIDRRPIRTGYVEAVAVAPGHQGLGFGSVVMTDVTSWIRERFELGALGTGRHSFYERLGWLPWLGPSSVRAVDGIRPTPDDDGFILVLGTPNSPPFRLTDPISADWRQGDAW
jgi:aminoglycoside 2'-N-acetyltransferase I